MRVLPDIIYRARVHPWSVGLAQMYIFNAGQQMTDDTRYTLDSILADWYQWAKGYLPVAGCGACAMFSAVQSGSRQWDTEGETTDSILHNAQMTTVDWIIGELVPLHRTALNLHARNLCTGRSVWASARLPEDAQARAVILGNARNALMARLVGAGVM